MVKVRVFGCTEVVVVCEIEVPEEASLKNHTISEKDIYHMAKKKFQGIHTYSGNGGDDKLIGVNGENESITADNPVEFNDWERI